MGKQTHRIRNWSDYNKALVKRGSLTLWFDEEAISSWYNAEATGKRGRPRCYSDSAILTVLTIRALFHLPLRGAKGLVQSLITLLHLPIEAPDYSTLSRRQKDLIVPLPYRSQEEEINLVVDSTGLKIYGEGEWKVRQHGYSKRRTWRKLHLAINPETHMIESSILTSNEVHDSEVFDKLLDDVNVQINQVCADGAYDTNTCYEALEKRGSEATIPPRKNAKIQKHGNRLGPKKARDENLRSIRTQGRKCWKQESGYHQRSLAETGMFRFKKIFGYGLVSRILGSQAKESLIRCRALNIITALGMPESVLTEAA